MKILQVACILIAITVIAVCQPLIAKRLILTAPPAAAETETTSALPDTQASAVTAAPPVAETVVPAVSVRRVSAVPVVIPQSVFSPRELAYEDDRQLGVASPAGEVKVATLEEPDFSMRDAGSTLRDNPAE